MRAQVVDDILDFTQTAEQLGKPRYQDIASGNLTAPTLFAMRRCPELLELVEGEFLEEGALQRAVELIEANGGAARVLRPACLNGSSSFVAVAWCLATERAGAWLHSAVAVGLCFLAWDLQLRSTSREARSGWETWLRWATHVQGSKRQRR